jgi:Tfp pilus assembly protein FimV
VELLERGLEAAPTNADVKVTLARAYAKSGRRDDARRLMEQVLASRDPLKTAAEQEHVNDKARRLLAELR